MSVSYSIDIPELLTELEKRNIIIKSKNGNIEIFDPYNNLNEELISHMKMRKTEIIEFFEIYQQSNTYRPIPFAEKKEYYELSSMQKRLYFLWEMDRSLTNYNMPSIIYLKETISKEEIKRRRDLREVTTFTIDPADAKDFDDALSVQWLKNGNVEIGVHIADVTHYVQPKTELEKEAAERSRADEALRESEVRLKTVLDTVQAGIVVIDPERHVIVGANAAAGRMVGAPREEILDSPCHQYICRAEEGECPITDLGKNLDNVEQILLTARGKKYRFSKQRFLSY